MGKKKKVKAILLGGKPDARYSIIVVGDTVIIPSKCGIEQWEKFVKANHGSGKKWKFKCSDDILPRMSKILLRRDDFLYAGVPDVTVTKKAKEGNLRSIYDLTIAKTEGSVKE